MRNAATSIDQLRHPNRPYPSSNEMVEEDESDKGWAVIRVITPQQLLGSSAAGGRASFILDGLGQHVAYV